MSGAAFASATCQSGGEAAPHRHEWVPRVLQRVTHSCEARLCSMDNLRSLLRKILMFEHAPCRHVCARCSSPDLPGADLAVLFMHNEGYSTMCGHAIIALGRYAVESGPCAPGKPSHPFVNIELPCGLSVAEVHHARRRPLMSVSRGVPGLPALPAIRLLHPQAKK